MTLLLRTKLEVNGNTNLISFRKALKASRCRRRREREKLTPHQITCWKHTESPAEVTSIEIDRRGARLVLPWNSVPGEHIRVSLSNQLGEHSTTRARIVWTQKVGNSSVIAGLAFDNEVTLVA